MISALATLGRMEAGDLPQNIQSSGINSSPSFLALFATHPPIEARISALQRLKG